MSIMYYDYSWAHYQQESINLSDVMGHNAGYTHAQKLPLSGCLWKVMKDWANTFEMLSQCLTLVIIGQALLYGAITPQEIAVHAVPCSVDWSSWWSLALFVSINLISEWMEYILSNALITQSSVLFYLFQSAFWQPHTSLISIKSWPELFLFPHETW